MVQTSALTALVASILLAPSAVAEGLYSKSSSVLSVDGRSYRDLIEKSNHTSIVEFYAPWCGHCKNLKPAYEKAAKALSGLAKVAAINCDDEENKPFCGTMGVQGFPTLKIVKPGKSKGRPIVEDYRGERTTKAIVEAVKEKIPNHVRRLKDSDYEAWLEESDGPKAVLFSEKGITSALLKAVAVDYLGSLDIAQIRSKETAAVQVFGVEKYPTLVLLPGEGKDQLHYSGEMTKEAIVTFLSQAATPNPDPAPKEKKAKSSGTNKSKASKASSSFAKASASHESSEFARAKASQTSETLEDASNPTESPSPEVDSQKPIKVPTEAAPPIPTLLDGLSLQQKCLNTKAGTCILALLPANALSESGVAAIQALSEIAHKHAHANRHLFPFYQSPTTNSQATALRKHLDLGTADSEVALLAINGKRAWYEPFPSDTPFTQSAIETWIDAIRMGDTPKRDVSSNLIVDAAKIPSEPIQLASNEEMEKMMASMRGSLPEGVDFELEEIDDDRIASLLAQARKPDASSSSAAPDPVVTEEREPTAAEAPEAEEEKSDMTIIMEATGGPNETPLSAETDMQKMRSMSAMSVGGERDEL